MKKTWLTLSVCSLVLGLAAGCGDDDGGGGFSTSLDDSEVLGELSAKEQAQLCADMEDFFDGPKYQAPALDLTCRLQGITAASTADSEAGAQDACADAYQACMERGVSMFPEPECPPVESSCKATVGEFQTCVKAFPSIFDDLAELVPSCDSLTMESLADFVEASENGAFDEIEPPAACAKLEQECPGSFEDESDF